MNRIRKATSKMSIQTLITLSFSALMVIGMGFLGFVLYQAFGNRMMESVKNTSELLLLQAADHLEDYLYNTQEVVDALNNSITKQEDLSQDDLGASMDLLYKANMDSLVSVAYYSEDGQLLASVPYSMPKRNVDVTAMDWFLQADRHPDDLYMSAPHVQNLFDIGAYDYFWVVSLSRSVNLSTQGISKKGVLVADMNYSSIGNLFLQLNEDSASTYTYLMSEDGTLIYHPNANLISSELFSENVEEVMAHPDGSWRETFEGERRLVTVKSIDRAGWRIVQVTPESAVSLGMQDTRYFVIIIVIIFLLILSISTLLVSAQITRPLSELTRSIEIISEDGLPENIYVGGSYEVEYLGKSLNDFVLRLRELMRDIVQEQEEKRKSELDALQSQINPHFLYNTLDSIVWMIEGERYPDAIFMIRQLASLFRISLSKGKTMITIEDELRHAQNYMNIQKIRYRNRFRVIYDIDPVIRQCVIVKLVLQPILENALYYAIEALDGDGEILIRGFKKEEDIYLQVIDNGMGMTEETVEKLLVEGNRVHKHGSGVGLVNVHKRLKIRFGEEYGLKIESELDEGTIVTIHLPYQMYEEGEKNE